MKTTQLGLFLIFGLLGSPRMSVQGQEKPLINEEGWVRWQRYPYRIRSSYPYLDQLPAWSKIPTLLKWINKDIRALRKSTRGRLEWERWQNLTTEQADNFAFALAYAIDNPWLLRGVDRARKSEGRNFPLYHSSFRYEFADMDGNTWWNDDPWNWYGGKNSDDNFLHAGGILRLLLWPTFPDNATTNAITSNSAGWRSVKMPDSGVLEQLSEDLFLRGEIIDTLQHCQRLGDGLEALEEFGTTNQIPAISRLEAELPARMEKVKSLLAQDPNGAIVESDSKRLLSAAARARTSIRRRSSGHKQDLRAQ